MELSVLLFYLVVGLFVARLWGGFLGISHGSTAAGIGLIYYPLATWYQPWPIDVALVGALLYQFSDGHTYSKPWKILTRYGWMPLVLAIMFKFPALAAIGPVTAVTTGLMRDRAVKFWGYIPQGKDENGNQKGSWFVDGWASYFELTARGSSMLGWAALAMFGDCWWYESLVGAIDRVWLNLGLWR